MGTAAQSRLTMQTVMQTTNKTAGRPTTPRRQCSGWTLACAMALEELSEKSEKLESSHKLAAETTAANIVSLSCLDARLAVAFPSASVCPEWDDEECSSSRGATRAASPISAASSES